MKLYDFTLAPNPRRARIFIAEKGLDVDLIQVDLRNGENLSDEYKAINPHLTVPVLQLDDGTLLRDNLSIASYLEATHPTPPLLGSSPIETALVWEWNSRIVDTGMTGIAEVFRNSNPAYAKRGLTGPSAHAAIPALVERGRARAADFFAMLNEHLQGRDYIVGDAFSMADITALCTADFAGFVKVGIADEQENLKRWYASVSNRPTAKA